MPGKSLFHDAATSGQGMQPPAAPGRTLLHVVDATLPAGSPAASVSALRAAATAAVRAGGGHVLDASHVIFPNGAVTLVLILAESHLAIHTWPEEDRIAIDLFSCGAIDGEQVTADLVAALRLTGVRTQLLDRGPAQTAAAADGASPQAGTDSDSPN
jgi:S-adenosylmethionine/arginine decarboxylase-like enzyme